jgi:23S rRNA pseudouridine955/2504/2580 synthase
MSRIHNKKSPVQLITIDSDDDTRRIDNFLMARLKGLPRTRIYQMLRRGEVRVNKGRVRQGYRLQKNDIVRIPPVSTAVQEDPGKPPVYMLDMLHNAVLFEDEHIIALNKPSGIVVHSGSGRSFGVIEVLRYLRPDESNLQLVHRVDQATSGCLLLSKTVQGLKQLHQALRSRQVEKQYIALLKGDIGKQLVNIDIPLKKNTMLSGERVVTPDMAGKTAQSCFKRRQVFKDSCLTDIIIETGRTHQIRVHSQYIGHPVAGDDKYGDRDFNKILRRTGLKRLFLHASQLKLPDYGKNGLTIKAPLPDELQVFLQQHG